MERKNVFIVIFVITTIIASCISVYFAVEKSNLVREIDTLKKQISVESETKTENVVESKTDIVDVSYKMAAFNSEKVVNKQENVTYDNTVRYMYDTDAIRYSINSKGVLELVKQIDYVDNEIKVSGINEKVIDVNGGIIGQGQSGVVVAITENGNVYLSENIYSGVEDNVLTFEKVENVSDIVRVISTGFKVDNFESGVTFVAIDANGNCYDLLYKVQK